MKRKRFKEEQIIKILQSHEAGVPLAELSREYGFAEGTIYTWKAKYGGMVVWMYQMQNGYESLKRRMVS